MKNFMYGVIVCIYSCLTAFAEDPLVTEMQRWITQHFDQLEGSYSVKDLMASIRGDMGKNCALLHIRGRSIRLIHNPSCHATEWSRRFKLQIKVLRRALEGLPFLDMWILLSLSDDLAPWPDKVIYFGYCCQQQYHQMVLIPDAETIEDMERLSTEMKVGMIQFPWGRKKEILFWRGVTTDDQYRCVTLENFLFMMRSRLVTMSLDYPEWVDAHFTDCVQAQTPSIRKTIVLRYQQYFSRKVLERDNLGYKYLIAIDGITAPWCRLVWHLMSNSVVFKQDSPWIQWFYLALQPGVHYIPVAHDLANLMERLEWAKSHDAECRMIVGQAQTFAEQYLTRDSMIKYLRLVLLEYHRRQIGYSAFDHANGRNK